MTVRVAVTGATGRMGRAVLDVLAERDDCEAVLAVNRDPDGTTVAGTPVEDSAEFAALLAERDADVCVDFTGPDSCVEYVAACAEAGVAAVVGTTGLSDGQVESLRATSETVPVLKATNFSRGIQALLRTVRVAVDALDGYDLELLETHHNGKVDAPSGTANTILETVQEQRDVDPVYGREGHAPRDEDEIGVLARRAGDVRGEHELVLAGNDEVVSLSHRAEDRAVFAAGAVDAAAWLAGRAPGWYDFGQVVDGGTDTDAATDASHDDSTVSDQ